MIAQAPSRRAALPLPTYLPWETLLAAVLATIMFVPARRYTLSSGLPFQLEPYRVVVAMVLVAWVASALIDPRVRFRRTAFDGPIAACLVVAILSLAANPGRERVPDILKCFSLRPDFFRQVVDVSGTVHFTDGHLPRRAKEAIATLVSGLNLCPY